MLTAAAAMERLSCRSSVVRTTSSARAVGRLRARPNSGSIRVMTSR